MYSNLPRNDVMMLANSNLSFHPMPMHHHCTPHALHSPQPHPYHLNACTPPPLNDLPSASSSELKGESFLFPLMANMNLKESEADTEIAYDREADETDIDEHGDDYLSTRSPLSVSPSIGYNDHEDVDCFVMDERPSLRPKYTDDTTASSNLTAPSTLSSTSVSCRSHDSKHANSMFRFDANHTAQAVSSNLIYCNMQALQSASPLIAQPANTEDEDEQFAMIDDDEDDYFDVLSMSRHLEQFALHRDHTVDDEEAADAFTDYIDSECDDDDMQAAFTRLQPPSIDTTELAASPQVTRFADLDADYDEDGEHSLSIPTEFRSLCVSVMDDNATPALSASPRTLTDADLQHLCSTLSDDDDVDVHQHKRSTLSAVRSKKTAARQKKTGGRRHRKRKQWQHNVPKHIQHKIEIHEAIRALPVVPAIECDSERRDGVQPSLQFIYDQTPKESVMELPAPQIDVASYKQRTFDFSVRPQRIRLSDETCQHLVDLCEYQTDDEAGYSY